MILDNFIETVHQEITDKIEASYVCICRFIISTTEIEDKDVEIIGRYSIKCLNKLNEVIDDKEYSLSIFAKTMGMDDFIFRKTFKMLGGCVSKSLEECNEYYSNSEEFKQIRYSFLNEKIQIR